MDHWVIWDVGHSCLMYNVDYSYQPVESTFTWYMMYGKSWLLKPSCPKKANSILRSVDINNSMFVQPEKEEDKRNLCCPIVGLTAVEEAGPKGDNVESFSNLGNCVMAECPVLVMTSMTMTMNY